MVVDGRRVFKQMWPGLRHWPLACHRSKTEHTHTQRESAPCGTILNCRQNKEKNMIRNQKLNSNQQFGLCFLSTQKRSGLCSNERVKLFLCFWSCLPSRLRMCSCMCRLPLPSRLNCTKRGPRGLIYDTVTMVKPEENTASPVKLQMLLQQFSLRPGCKLHSDWLEGY